MQIWYCSERLQQCADQTCTDSRIRIRYRARCEDILHRRGRDEHRLNPTNKDCATIHDLPGLQGTNKCLPPVLWAIIRYKLRKNTNQTMLIPHLHSMQIFLRVAKVWRTAKSQCTFKEEGDVVQCWGLQRREHFHPTSIEPTRRKVFMFFHVLGTGAERLNQL